MVSGIEAVLLPLILFNPSTSTWPNEAKISANNTGGSCSTQNSTHVYFNNVHCTLDRLIEVPVGQIFPNSYCVCSGMPFDNITLEIWELSQNVDSHKVVSSAQTQLSPTVDKDNVGRPMIQYCSPGESLIPADMAEQEITFAWRDQISYKGAKGYSTFQQCRVKGKAASSASIITSPIGHLVLIASFATMLKMLDWI